MPFPILESYLARLPHEVLADTRVWMDAEGRAQGRYFNCTLTSAFQPVRTLATGQVAGFEAFARSYSEKDSGLSLWKLLDHAANDDESIELDRLCRMLHAINFYRQSESKGMDLYLSVHDRLLAAVSGNHGMAFRRILDGLGLPVAQIVLQLPAVTSTQRWLLNYVADNYRLNGFRVAVNTGSAKEALQLLERIRPDVVKIDARELGDVVAVRELFDVARSTGLRVVFKRLESVRAFETLQQLSEEYAFAAYGQGHLLDKPEAVLNAFGKAHAAPPSQAQSAVVRFAT